MSNRIKVNKRPKQDWEKKIAESRLKLIKPRVEALKLKKRVSLFNKLGLPTEVANVRQINRNNNIKK